MRTVVLFIFLLLAFIAGPQSKLSAGLIIDVSEVGNDVVATGTGTLNISALTLLGPNIGSGAVRPNRSLILLGAATNGTLYRGMSGPTNMGTGVQVLANSSSGDTFGIFRSNDLVVPENYVSGTALAGTSTWSNRTLASLSWNPGTYTFTWGSGGTADSIIVNVGQSSAVPEPSSLALLGFGAVAISWSRRRLAQFAKA